MGKASEPTKEELEFIYTRIPTQSDTSIIEELIDAGFPRRCTQSITRRRKEYSAAKRVLEEQLRREIDPVITPRRVEHFNQLVDIAETLIMDSLNTVTTTREDVTNPEYVGYEDGVYESPEYPVSREQLVTALDQHIEIVYTKYTAVKFSQQFIPHLIAEIPDIATNGLGSYITEHPYELIDTLRILVDRKTFKGKCPVCEEW